MTRDGIGFTRLWLAACVVGLVGGRCPRATDHTEARAPPWAVTTVIGGIPVTIDVIRSISRREAGVDLIAIIAIIGCLASARVRGGRRDRRHARERPDPRGLRGPACAPRALRSVRARAAPGAPLRGRRAPRRATIDDVVLGDRLFVKSGEVVPVDGVLEGDAVLDESALSGESRPVERPRGDLVRSGAVNAGQAFDLHATATAADSTYAGIVRLVEAAQSERAPAVRLADRYALWFIPITLVIAGAAWAISGRRGPRAVRAGGRHTVPADPRRADRDRCRHLPRGQARHHRQGRRRARDGRPIVDPAVRQDRDVDLRRCLGSRTSRRSATIDPAEVLRLAASLDQVSPHVLATRDRARGTRTGLRRSDVPRGRRRAVRVRGSAGGSRGDGSCSVRRRT